jgi:hypothetical protein
MEDVNLNLVVDDDILYPLVPEHSKPTLFQKCVSIMRFPFVLTLGLVGVSLYLVIVLFFLVLLSLVSVSGIGPMLQYYCERKDKDKNGGVLHRENLMNVDPNIFFLTIPGDVNAGSGGKPYVVFVRVTRPSSAQLHESALPPLMISNGLASNAVCIFKAQDIFTKQLGLTTVIYDRLNVGLSDSSPADAPNPSAIDSSREVI